MEMNYSFNEIPILSLQKLIFKMIPGLEKVLSVYRCPEMKEIIGMIINHDDEILQNIALPKGLFFDELRKKKQNFSWHHRDELPFLILKPKEKQINMFDNHEVVLIIRILNNEDGFSDLLIIYFREDSNYFGILKNNKTLTQENKFIIGNFLYNSITAIAQKDIHDREIFRKQNSAISNIIKRTKFHRDEFYSTMDKYENSLIDLSKKYLEEITAYREKQFSFSEEAIKELKNYKGELANLRGIIEKAVLEAEIINIGQDTENIIVDEFMMDIGTMKSFTNRTLEINSKVEDKYSKTRTLLDKLDNAVIKLKNKEIKITGSNIGKVLPVPVSAPAISDALKKHKSRIRTLMHDHPGKWSSLRNEFRPMQNLLLIDESRSA